MEPNDEAFQVVVGVAGMNEFEEFQSALGRLSSRSPLSLLIELAKAYQRILQLEKECNDLCQQRGLALDTSEMFARRCELSVAICRDDEQALTSDKLSAIAKIIWPSKTVNDPTQIPTKNSGMVNANHLICQAKLLLDSIPKEVTTGGIWQSQLSEWHSHVSIWEFENEDELRS